MFDYSSRILRLKQLAEDSLEGARRIEENLPGIRGYSLPSTDMAQVYPQADVFDNLYTGASQFAPRYAFKPKERISPWTLRHSVRFSVLESAGLDGCNFFSMKPPQVRSEPRATVPAAHLSAGYEVRYFLLVLVI